MYIDIHRHSADPGTANIFIRNLFHNQTNEIIPGSFFSVGLHPWNVNLNTLTKDVNQVLACADNPLIVAVGETGLDKKIKTGLEIQLRAFELQIEIAKSANKPMIIHCVGAYNEIFELKLKSGATKPWLLHWFNANVQMGLQLVSKGFYLSFGHMLFKKDSKACKAFTQMPLEFIFFETDDAGYEIDEIYHRASELLAIPLSVLEKKIEQNFESFFGIKP